MPLTTLDAVKTWIGVGLTDVSKDTLLELLIESVSAEIESHCDRVFSKEDYTKTVELYGPGVLLLDQYPVLVASVTMSDETVLDDIAILPMGGLQVDWNGKYTIEYTAGYTLPGDATETDPRTLPKDLEYACLSLIGIAYNKRGSEHLSVEVIGPLRSEYLQDMPLYLKNILSRYKRPVIA